jgi:hypothetical protein
VFEHCVRSTGENTSSIPCCAEAHINLSLDIYCAGFSCRCAYLAQSALPPASDGRAGRTTDFTEIVVQVVRTGGFLVKQIFYSAPSRLIGQRLRVHIYDNRIEAYLGSSHVVKAVKGEQLTQTIERKAKDGTVTKVERPLRVWFFQQGELWFLQPRYGARVMLLDGKSNAIQAAKLADLDAILVALGKAAQAGELDPVLEAASQRKTKPNLQ